MNRSVLRGIILIALAIGAIAALIILPGSKPKSHPPNNDPWVLVNYDPDTQYGTYLGNGFISTRIMGDGVGSQCFMAGLYDNDALIPTPNWADLRFYYRDTEPFRIDRDEPYKQSLDLRTGVLTTSATWRAGRNVLVGKIEAMVSRSAPNVGLVRATMVGNFSNDLRVEAPVVAPQCLSVVAVSARTAGSDIMRTYRVGNGGAYLAYHGKICFERDSGRGNGQWLSGEEFVLAGTPFTIVVCASLAAGVTQQAAEGEVTRILPPDYDYDAQAIIAAHKSAMSKLWAHDIIIDGPVQDQQAIHACMFYLMQSAREGSQTSIPPMGLSGNGYQGHIFWDADTWMFPALILQHPELAKSIVDYRYNTLKGAMANAKAEGLPGARYAWESAVTGSECTPKGLVYRNERHINGDVALAQWQYYLATGDLDWLKSRGFPVIKATADWWAGKAKYFPEKKRYEILQVVPPDENAELVNNSAYTNAVAKMNLQIAIQAAKLTHLPANPKWAEVADRMYIPFDAANKRFIAHDGYRGDTAKQADTELLAYPLQFEMPGADMAAVYRNTLDYYAPKVHKNGPAMISSAHSVIAARLGLSDRAYADFQKSYQPYFRGPFCLFNEKATRTFDNTCFLTGAAGPVQAAIFGFAGARIEYFPKDPAKAELTFHPCLPKAWKSLKITGVRWRGKTFDVTITQGNKVRKEFSSANPE